MMPSGRLEVLGGIRPLFLRPDMVPNILVPTKYRDLIRKDVDIHAVQTVFATDAVTFPKFPTSHSIPLVKLGQIRRLRLSPRVPFLPCSAHFMATAVSAAIGKVKPPHPWSGSVIAYRYLARCTRINDGTFFGFSNSVRGFTGT